MRQPTQVDVARIAGVSRATVSYVVNGPTKRHVPISEETRRSVLEAIEALGYEPDVRAQVFVSVPAKLIIALAVAMLLNQKLRGGAVLPRGVLYPHTPRRLGGHRRAVEEAVRERRPGERTLGSPWLYQSPRLDHQPRIRALDARFVGGVAVRLVDDHLPRGAEQNPEEYNEAASVDGANKVRPLFAITIPLLSPVILFNLVMQMISAFQAFTQADIIGGGRGGVLNSTLFYTLHLT
jgi:multiple sugar transport system permease protein